MKILFINPFFPPWAPGGAEHSLEQMCIHFSRNGWTVQVLAAAFDKRGLDEERSGYWVRWIHAPFHVEIGQDIEAEDYFRTAHFRELVFARFSQMEPPDVIIANNAQVYGIVGSLGRKYGIPTIAIVRDTQIACEFGSCMDNMSAIAAKACRGYIGAAVCSILFQRLRGGRGWRPLPAWSLYGMLMHKRRRRLRSALLRFDHVITISEALNILIRKTLPSLEQNCITTIRNFSTQVQPIDILHVNNYLEQHGLVAGKYFLFAGRKTYGKGSDLLLAATAIAKRILPECRSLFLGRGKLAASADSGCIDGVSVSQDLLMGLLQHSAALVIPGRWQEGLHRTMVDAISFGIPVICTQAGAPPIDGIEHEKNGLVCVCNDSNALATSMLEVLSWDKKKRDDCRKESHRIYLQRFANDVNMNNWSRVLSSLVQH